MLDQSAGSNVVSNNPWWILLATLEIPANFSQQIQKIFHFLSENEESQQILQVIGPRPLISNNFIAMK